MYINIRDMVLDAIRNNKIVVVKIHKNDDNKITTIAVAVYIPPYDNKEFYDLSFLVSVENVDLMCSNKCDDIINELKNSRFHVITR